MMLDFYRELFLHGHVIEEDSKLSFQYSFEDGNSTFLISLDYSLGSSAYVE